MFENIIKFFKSLGKNKNSMQSKDAAKERLHLVLMQDRANISADFLALMKQEIIEVIKKYIDVDENAIDVRLTNKSNDDGTTGAPVLYANIPIVSVKEEAKEQAKKVVAETNDSKENVKEEKEEKKEEKKEEEKQEDTKKSDTVEKEDNKKVEKQEVEKETNQTDETTKEVIEKAEEIVEEINEEVEKETL